jgi:hypothetical protein
MIINFTQIGSITVDLIVICAFIISVFQAYRNGLTIMIFNMACLVITLIAVLILCKPVTNWVYNHTGIDEFLADHIEDTIGDFLDKQLEDKDYIDTSKTNISETIATKINNYITEAKEQSVDNVSGFVAEKLSYIAVSAIVVIGLCIVVRFATVLLRGVLFFLSNLPFVRTFDRLGGAIYGIIRGFVLVYFVLAIFSLFSPLLANTGIIACIKASSICSNFYNNNIFLRMLG